MKQNKKRRGVDIDDTLFDFIGAYSLFHNITYKTRIKKEDFISYNFNEIIGGTIKEATDSVSAFYNTPFFRKMKPFPNSIEIIQELKKNNELFIITSRPLSIKEETFNQIFKYFPNTFSKILFSSNYYSQAKNNGKTKAEICQELSISFLIDDSLIYAKECVHKGIGAILFDSPWNKNGEIEEIIRVKNWKEIGEVLK